MYNEATKYAFCLSNDQEQAYRAFLLLFKLENYVNGAIIQTNRITRTRKASWDRFHDIMQQAREFRSIPTRQKRDYSSTRLYCDFHFYFICIGQIHKILKRLNEILNDRHINIIYDRFKESFPEDIRHELEHFDERAVGKKKGVPIDVTNFSFGNFYNDKFSYGEDKYAVNKTTLKLLKKYYEEILAILHKNYGLINADFVLQENMEKQQKFVSKLTKKYQQQYKDFYMKK